MAFCLCWFGCSTTVGVGEAIAVPAGYCSTPPNCVDCNPGYHFDSVSDLNCEVDCPLGASGTSDAGCHPSASKPSNAVVQDLNWCDNSVFSLDCYSCNAGYEYNVTTTDCCMSDQPDGSTITCSSDAQCCSGHCSDYIPGSGPLTDPNDWRCCAQGFYWSPNAGGPGVGKCVPASPCYDVPCPYRENLGEAAWWDFNPACISNSQACCYTDLVSGYLTYDYLPNTEY